MSDIAGIVLHKVLSDPEDAIEIWPKLKVYLFDSDHSKIYSAIHKYYNKYGTFPSFTDLKIISRDEALITNIISLEKLNVPEELDSLVVVQALLDNYTQDETLSKLSDFVDKIQVYDTDEIKERLTGIVLELDEKTSTSEEIYLMDEILTFDKEEQHSMIPLGINNNFDAETGGMSLTNLFMIGGKRGSGKSVVACNIIANQYNQGNVGLFFSIEMRFREIFNRFISILSRVDHNKLRKQQCEYNDFVDIARVRSNMFTDGEEVFNDFLAHKDYEKFELDLIKSKSLKQDNQLIIVDNQFLTLADIDVTVKKFKAKHGDRLKTVVVDYVNQIQLPDMYDWKVQIGLSKKLKNIARKHDVLMVTPYQIDASGEARFAKGVLDAADVATTINGMEDHIEFESTKVRNIKPFKFNAPVNWDTLEILPTDYIPPVGEDEETSNDIGGV